MIGPPCYGGAGIAPVRIRAGAFGPGRPRRDLLLSPDHAVFFEGDLIPVKSLTSGAGVARLDVARVRDRPVEPDCHGVLLAEGLTAAVTGRVVDRLHPHLDGEHAAA
ncbi:MAG: Hint domain-containing protein [Acetobacteraceae bacterium]